MPETATLAAIGAVISIFAALGSAYYAAKSIDAANRAHKLSISGRLAPYFEDIDRLWLYIEERGGYLQSDFDDAMRQCHNLQTILANDAELVEVLQSLEAWGRDAADGVWELIVTSSINGEPPVTESTYADFAETKAKFRVLKKKYVAL